MTTATMSGLDRDRLIDCHPRATQIRHVLSTAYNAFSKRHKLGLDALSWCLGPMAPFGFCMVDDHREQQAQECREALQSLLCELDNNIADRRILGLLLEDYPGRDYEMGRLLRLHLQRQD